MLKYIIAIPSYKRADRLLNKKSTLSQIDKHTMDNVYLFVRDEEEEDYLKVAEHFGCGLITITAYDIPETRDQILQYAYEHDVEKLIMIDDDIDIAYKPTPKKYITITNNDGHFGTMIIDLLSYCASDCPIVGISARQFSQDKKGVDFNTRVIQVFCIHMPTIKKENFHFADAGFSFMTDYYFILTFLQKGYKNACLNWFTRDDDSQTPGGCSVFRTVENQSKSAVALYKKFPHLVSLYIKDTGTWSAQRVNVRIKWKKAFQEKK